MTYLLDTNAIIALLRGNTSVVRKARFARSAELLLSVIVQHELYFGAYGGDRANETLRRLDGLALATLPFDEVDARVAAEIRSALKRTGTPIGPYDTLIAGQALARDLTLVTRNTREFERVAGLRLENWEA